MGRQKNKNNPAARTKPYPLEDRALKEAAQLFGEEILPLLGVSEGVLRAAPTEQAWLNPQELMEDFNYEMKDGSWSHVEFESDGIRTDDLRRFRAYEAVMSYTYKVPVTTYVVCSANVRELKNSLAEGVNTYRVKVLRLKDKDAAGILQGLERREQETGSLRRADLLQLVLIPLRGGSMPQTERISRAVALLRKMHSHMEKDDLLRIEAALYTLAMKFLTMEELKKIKELMNMTVLGEMILQDGIDRGIKQGIKQEQKNTERERKRAEQAEARIRELEEMLEQQKGR